MAKTKDPLEKKKNKLDIAIVLYAIDTKNKNFYNNLSDDFKKQYAAFVIMRFMSSAPDQNDIHDHHLLATNDFVNQDFWTLSKYPDFQHLLLCLVGSGKKTYHNWITNPKREIKDKVKVFFDKIYPGINSQELKILYKNHSVDEFKQLCRDYALDDKEIKDLVENFKKLKEII